MSDPRRKHSVQRVDRQLAKAVQASKSPAISRAIAVLHLLGNSDVPLGLRTIASQLGLVPSTCLYVLRALADGELVAFDPDTKRYSLEVGVLTLARHWLSHNQFNELAQPAMDRIAQTFDVTMIGLQVVGLQHIVVVAVSKSNSNMQLSMQIGSHFPALNSASGRCIAAFGGYAEADLLAPFGILRWDNAPTFDAWKAQVRQTRAHGFAVDEGCSISGVTTVAAPVWTRQQLSHTIVAVGLSSTLKRAGLPKLQKATLAAAQELSNQLRGEGPAPPTYAPRSAAAR